MTRRMRAFGVLGILVAVVLLAAPASTKPWTLRTPDGQPDLQGFWTNTTYTRWNDRRTSRRSFIQKRKRSKLQNEQPRSKLSRRTRNHTRRALRFHPVRAGPEPGPLALNLRTSLIVDPPDGRIPPMTAEGQKRAAERAAARKRMGGATDAAQNQPLGARCIIMDRAGPPMLAGAYNNNYQIVQAPGYVMILVEMIHDARIIPLDGRPHLPANVRQWMGSSRGRWEGDTLVVETTNFTGKNRIQGFEREHALDRALHTRGRGHDSSIRFTVDDPATWTRPWSAETAHEEDDRSAV